jgi:hypothetical protein
MSDIHLSHQPPVWRSAEKDWYRAMHRSFIEIGEVVYSLSEHGNEDNDDRLFCIVAGDIFHKWNSPPKLINFAIDQFQSIRMYSSIFAIPGQHDLPNHLDDQIESSPYTTLCRANVIEDIDACDCEPEEFNGKSVFGYGWNTSLENQCLQVDIAVVHRYMWMDGCSYHKAPNTSKVTEIANQLGKPKLIIAGDNHVGFWHSPTRTFNCGGLYRRNKDQIDYGPRIGIIYSDLSVIPYYLDTSHDDTLGNFANSSIMEVAEKQEDIDEFLQELSQMGRGGLDFLDAVRRYTNSNGVRKSTQLLIEQILTGESNGKSSRRV